MGLLLVWAAWVLFSSVCPLQQASLGLLSCAQHSMRVRTEAVKPLDIYTWEECDIISVSLYWTKQVPTS